MKDTVRICMIGAGGMANSVHYPSLRSFDDVEIVGVCEMNRERLDATSQEFGIPEDRRYHAKSPENYKEMVAALKKGEEIVTNGGLLGKVTEVSDNFVTVEVSSGLNVRIQRQSISQVMPKGTY